LPFPFFHVSTDFAAEPPTTGKIIKKVLIELDFFLPFRQHAPSLANARREIYADISRFPGEDGAGFFNVLAFRGVFFGSPFAQSNRYQWFDTFTEWERFRAEGLEVAKQHSKNGHEETYYVKRNCYGQSQTDRSTKSKAFASLDLALRQELTEEEKAAMNYNVIMLEHALCKIKRLTARGIVMKKILQEI